MREKTPQQRVNAVMELIKMMLETIGRLLHECSLPNTSKFTSDELQMMRKMIRVTVFKINQNIMWNCLYRILYFSFSAEVRSIFFIILKKADGFMFLTVKKPKNPPPSIKYLVAGNKKKIPKNIKTAP